MERALTTNRLEKVSTGVPSSFPIVTFEPVVQCLPVKNIISADTCEVLTGKQEKETMSDGEIVKAEIVFIKDSVEGGAGNIIQPKWKPSLDHVSSSQTKASLSVSAQSENTPNYVAALTGSMETAVDKHRGISQQQCHDTFGREVSLGCFANRASVSDDKKSPTNCTDLFPTPASSRESILSEGWDKEKNWPAGELSSVVSPVSFSRTVSPCSSTRSGIFSPAVVQIRKHFLAPGSSLVNIPQTCFSSCESLSSSVCPEFSPPRRRPPLTRLSLLTAILRKGRLPVLSSALQRPYTPCWPINSVTLSSCNACSAASSVASIPLEFSSQFPSTGSINIQSHIHRESNRCVTAPPPLYSNEPSRTRPETPLKRCSGEIRPSNVPTWEQAISPPPAKSNTLPRVPVSLFCSNFKSVPPPKQQEILDCDSSKTLQNTQVSISKPHDLKPSNTHIYLKGHASNNLKNLITPSTKTINKQEPSALQKWSYPANLSLSRLQLLSERLRSSPVCPSQLKPSHSCSPRVTVSSTETVSPLPPFQNTTGRCEPDRTCPDTKSTTPSHGYHKVHCLSPSRYTPIVFSGWPSPTNSPTPSLSPAPPIRDLTPSPSLSLRTTPSPRPGSGISDCSDREGKKRKTHKIKLSYKSLAAIPTNTLLLDQQAIDEQVESEESPCDTLERGVTLDTHAEMCSPAQLRQQSEELYAVIDEVLANSFPPTKQTSRPSTTSIGLQQNNSSLPKSLGRETKYASICSLHPSAHVEMKKDSKKTKPGVIRPMTAIPRLTVEEEFHPTPFRPFVDKKTLTDHRKVKSASPEEAEKDFYSCSNGQASREERKPKRRNPFSVCDLYIKEPADQLSQPVTEGQMEAFETHF